MSEIPVWAVGNRNPSIAETITSDGAVVNLTGSTVRFKMRAVGTAATATPKVDAVATIVNAPGTDGQVRYDWAALDVDTAGRYLVWWEVATGANKQDMMEALVEFRAHGQGALRAIAYAELEEFKSTLTLTGTTFADLDIERVLVASSRAVDKIAHRRFYADADVNQVRYYTPSGHQAQEIDDLITLTTVVSDYDGDGTFEQAWVENTDFTLEPLNALADGRPWETIRQHPRSSYCFSPYPRSLKVTGKFGWAAVPEGAKVATSQIAARVLTILRQAPLGVAGVGLDGIAVRVSRDLPEVQLALGDLIRTQVLA